MRSGPTSDPPSQRKVFVYQDNNSLAALIGSRICHDLINPIGAVTNGLELLELSGAAKGPELALVARSVASANARIRFFRIAFGVAGKTQITSGAEVASILSRLYADGRISVNGFPAGDHPRLLVRALLLGTLCIEQTIPYGGDLEIAQEGETWAIRARGTRLRHDSGPWRLLDGEWPAGPVAPGAVQFLMLPAALRDISMKHETEITETKCEIRFIPA